MSRSANILLGMTLGFLTLGFVGVAWFTSRLEGMRATTIGMAILGSFCAVGALACLLPASRPIALRLIGGTVFLAFFGYLVEMAVSGPVLGNSRGDTSLVNAIIAFALFGLPAGYVAVTGRYPRWGQHSRAFEANNPQHPDTARDNSATES